MDPPARPAAAPVSSFRAPRHYSVDPCASNSGQPGEHGLFGITNAGQQYGSPPDDYKVDCNTASDDKHGLSATIPIVKPET